MSTNLEGVFIPAVLVSRVGGGTDIDVGFEACFNELKSQGTQQDNKILVLMTDGDGQTQRALDLRPEAIALNIGIITVGIGNEVDEEVLTVLASNENFYVQSEFDTLSQDILNAVDLTCTAASAPNTNTDIPTTANLPPVDSGTKGVFRMRL